MGLQTPAQRIGFGGLVTSGSPLDRPQDSSVRCRNLRLMPPTVAGGRPYLRLRGGRTSRIANTTESYTQFYEWSHPTAGVKNIAQYKSGQVIWRSLNLAAYSTANIHTTFIGGGLGTRAAIAGVRDKLFLASGYGIRTAPPDLSRPSLVSWDGTTIRYVGLDAFLVGGYPTVGVTPGAGPSVTYRVYVWVGLYNSTTGHFSNAIQAGYVNPTGGPAVITVSNLGFVTYASNNATEAAELYYVFYASIDGGETAYLILDGTEPLKLAVGGASKVIPAWTLDLTQERPIENYPPRNMDQIAYANGRVYGILARNFNGINFGALLAYYTNELGTGSAPVQKFYADFSYDTTAKTSAGALVWSAAASDQSDRQFTGVPEESWPLRNKKFTPNGEMPLFIDAAPGGSQLLVLTANATYLLYEAADGLHQWITVSEVDGIHPSALASYVKTPRGPIWLTRQNQIVMLTKDLNLRVLSEEVQSFLNVPGASYGANAADYLRDQRNQIDYYEIWKGSGAGSLVYDFAAGGQWWEKTSSFAVTAAKTMRDASGNLHHLLAETTGPIYTQEADPITGEVATRDGSTDINGDYISQWMHFGDPREQKRFTDLDIIGDGEFAPALSGVAPTRPLAVSYWRDFDTEEQALLLEKTGGSAQNQDHNYKARTNLGNPYWLKIRVQISGHGADQTTYPINVPETAEVPPNFYGCLYDMSPTVTPQRSRP